MSAIRQRLANGMALSEAIVDGMMEKVRPVVMTGLVPAIGFIPMALAHGTGAEVQKPLAMVVIGGLITATALTLLVLPAISQLVLGFAERQRRPREGREHLVPAE
jgi:cobalt-zinc-cadmium resistance protein CzcA